MPFDQKKAGRRAAELAKAADSLQKAVPKPGAKVTAARLKRIAALHQKISAANQDLLSAMGSRASALVARTEDQDPKATFDTFFSGVATSFANAQRTLDQRTEEYLGEIQNRPEFMRTAFRISKVSADMKFAVDRVESSSVGVIFVKHTSTRDVQNEQSVHFEMVAAPVPPGGGPVTPSVPLLFSAAARKTVFDAIGTLAVPGVTNLLVNPNRVLIYAEDPGKSVYLAYADEQSFGIWRLEIAGPALTVLRGFGRATGDLDAARKSLLQLGVQQEAFLRSIA